ncbi:hypothetical protein ACWEKM_32510 [Streptomyces sp. NPDC004752]
MTVRQPSTGRFVRRLDVRSMGGFIRSVHTVPAGGLVLSAGTDHVIRLWDLASGQCVGRLEGHGAPWRRCTCPPTGSTSWRRAPTGNLYVWDVGWELSASGEDTDP